jgi:putative radical SAM enzyme (TIGR03279 family)
MTTTQLKQVPAGLVAAVLPVGAGSRAGLQPGDRVLAINGVVPRDVIDVRMDSLGARVELDVERAGERLVLAADKDQDEDLGVEFESPAFDRLKTCNNACDFCFIRGLPRGLRRTLYIKDDDYRYSFLYGSFTTLTNLSDAEWRRILFQRLSPLRVSVHATDLSLRRELLGNAKAPDILGQLADLGKHGIEVHAQVVLMPGRNDRAVLEGTIADLAAHYATVQSVAVVPVGLTVHSRPRVTHPLDAADARAAIGIIEKRQSEHRKSLGCGFVYAADELYLLADRPLPGPRAYDDYPQLHNGVGMVQLFRTEWRQATRRLPAAVPVPASVAWATGALMAPILRECASRLSVVDGLSVEVIPVSSGLFGGQVTVAGLTAGKDVMAALHGRSIDRAVLPRSMFDAVMRRTIDGLGVEDIARELGIDVCVATAPRDLVERTLGKPTGHQPSADGALSSWCAAGTGPDTAQRLVTDRLEESPTPSRSSFPSRRRQHPARQAGAPRRPD